MGRSVFPKIQRQPNYFRWLGAALSKGQANRRAFLKIEKADINKEWENQAKQQWPNSGKRVQECLEQASSSRANEYFEKLQGTIAAELRKSEADADLEGLRLPEVPTMMLKKPDRRSGNVYFQQTYEAFAEEVQQRNGQSGIGKDTMDRAFNHAAKQVEGLPQMEFYRMVARCLRGSEKYWEDR